MGAELLELLLRVASGELTKAEVGRHEELFCIIRNSVCE
ncbi:MAG: UxaA family hydrolase [Thermanaeromonas sp.]|nr:UxaA family hydrolase [Thermanaeromonas sp.]